MPLLQDAQRHAARCLRPTSGRPALRRALRSASAEGAPLFLPKYEVSASHLRRAPASPAGSTCSAHAPARHGAARGGHDGWSRSWSQTSHSARHADESRHASAPDAPCPAPPRQSLGCSGWMTGPSAKAAPTALSSSTWRRTASSTCCPTARHRLSLAGCAGTQASRSSPETARRSTHARRPSVLPVPSRSRTAGTCCSTRGRWWSAG